MKLRNNKSKSQLVVNTVIVGLFSIAAMIFLYYLFISKVFLIRTSIKEEEAEVHAMNLANILISSKNLAYIDDSGVLHRGILDKGKLDNLFYFSENALLEKEIEPYIKESLTMKGENIRYYYQNSEISISVVDLDRCKSNYRCYTWNIIVAHSRFKIPMSDFANCLIESFDKSSGSLIKKGISIIALSIFNGKSIILSIWSPNDILQCLHRSLPVFVKELFTSKSPVSHQGLPVLIRYPDGSLHTGRIIVSLTEW